MIRMLAGNNANGHLDVLVRILMSESWIEFWNELEPTVVSFEDLL